jgi:hypothetical protein
MRRARQRPNQKRAQNRLWNPERRSLKQALVFLAMQALDRRKREVGSLI